MKITVRVARSSPSVEPELLVRFVIERCREVTEPSPVLVALALAMVSRDPDFYNRLKEVISSSDEAEEILGLSDDVFMPVLARIEDRQFSDNPERGEENPYPDETMCERVLRYAQRESRKMLTEKQFEFVRVAQVLIKAGLSCYSFRLAQFESVCDSSQDDPENLLRQGIEILKDALFQPGKRISSSSTSVKPIDQR